MQDDQGAEVVRLGKKQCGLTPRPRRVKDLIRERLHPEYHSTALGGSSR
jgi:hypothetical protein